MPPQTTSTRPAESPRQDTVRFVLDGEVITVRDPSPTRTVLQYLREDLRRTGTKEGCAEGDCGACTVVLAELDRHGERLHFRAINSCIQFLPTLDGKELITTESLVGRDGSLHPVQRAMVECHGSQCGFCTPGFVMSLFALYKTRARPARREIDRALAGNLCRCTGYRPIVEAAQKMYDYGGEIDRADQHWMNCSFASAGEAPLAPGERKTLDMLRALKRRDTLALAHGPQRYFAPGNVDDLAALVRKHPDACLLAGGTDVGLWVTKQHRDLDTVIYTGNVAELRELAEADGHLDIGASATLSDAVPAILAHYPELDELFERFASPPIRNAGTLGGNIANGSPIGDSMPVLIALATRLVLRKGKRRREIALEDYYLDYQKTARAPGEFLERIRIPLRTDEHTRVRSYKISKRFDQDISAVCAAFSLRLERDKVHSVRIAYGGVAATPKRAPAAEQALLRRDWNEASVQAAMAALERDYTPIGDMRASEGYRRRVSQNLLYRFFLETTGAPDSGGVYNVGR